MGMLGGTLAYFAAPIEITYPPVLLASLLLLVFARHRVWAFWLGCAGIAFAIGLSVSALRTDAVGCDGAWQTGRQDVTGWLERVDRSGSGRHRLYIRDADSGCRVRVIASLGTARLGDSIAVRAVLERPPRAAVPGAYDSRRPLYFQRIVRTGYAISAVGAGPPITGDGGWRWLARLRGHIADRIRSSMSERNGGVAAALLTGDRSGIPGPAAETLRQSGLGHVLAISGLHMALVAGGVFFAARFLSVLVIPWSRRGNTAWPAAMIALLAATAYLFVSGAGIPTQRAYVMTATALGAVLLGRRVLSMHTLAIAMLIVLLRQPESALGAGFQMSFAAAGALIGVAEILRERRVDDPLRRNTRWLAPLAGISMTSLIAGSATAGFAAFHFHRTARYGMIANILAMPVFSFLVMPAGLIALALMPLGLDGPGLAVMSFGLDVVFAIAERVVALPGAVGSIHAAPGWVLGAYATSFLFLVAGRGRWRSLALAGMLLAFVGWWNRDAPDLFVAEGGSLVYRDSEGWLSSERRRDRFARRVFLERQGAATVETAQRHCDAEGCRYQLERLVLIVTDTASALQEDCRRADVIIARTDVPDWLERRCAARLIDATRLSALGSHLFWIERGEIVRERSVDQQTRRRAFPWRR